MAKEKVTLETFSGTEKMIQLIQKVTVPIIVCCAFVLGYTSVYPWITIPATLMAPVVGIGLSKYGAKHKKSMRWYIALINSCLLFIICLCSGKNSPSFIIGFSNLLFVTLSFKKPGERIFNFIYSFTLLIVGTLLSEMDRYLILEGLICLIMYTAVLNQALAFVILQGKELEHQKQLVEEHHKEVMDSIRYAKRIQTALITSEKSIENSLNRLMKNN